MRRKATYKIIKDPTPKILRFINKIILNNNPIDLEKLELFQWIRERAYSKAPISRFKKRPEDRIFDRVYREAIKTAREFALQYDTFYFFGTYQGFPSRPKRFDQFIPFKYLFFLFLSYRKEVYRFMKAFYRLRVEAIRLSEIIDRYNIELGDKWDYETQLLKDCLCLTEPWTSFSKPEDFKRKLKKVWSKISQKLLERT